MGGLIMIGIPAGAIGGMAFWRIAIGGSAGPHWQTARNLMIIVSPLLVLYLGVYVVAGHRYSLREWAALPLADPSGFGIFIAVAALVALSLAIDRQRRLTRH